MSKYDQLLDTLLQQDVPVPTVVINANVTEAAIRKALRLRLANLTSEYALLEIPMPFVQVVVSASSTHSPSSTTRKVTIKLLRTPPSASDFDFDIVDSDKPIVDTAPDGAGDSNE